MTPPPSPPGGGGYGPHKPTHGRDAVDQEIASTLSTLELRVEDVRQAIEGFTTFTKQAAKEAKRAADVVEARVEDTGVQRINTHALAAQVDAALAEAAKQLIDRMRTSVKRWVTIAVLGSSGIAGGSVWWLRANPGAEAAEVQRTVEDQGAAVTDEVTKQGERLTEVEDKVDKLETVATEQQIQLVDGIEYLGRKIDKVNARAENVPEPKTLESARTKLRDKRTREDLFKAEGAESGG